MIVDLLPRGGNEATTINPPAGVFHISTHGSDWLWAAFSVIAFSFVLLFGLSFTRPRGKRAFHHIGLVILITASIAYFTMASDLGYAPVPTEFRGDHQTRQIWYTRYIQWFLTLPLVLIELLLTTGFTLSDIMMTVAAAWVLVLAGLIGSVVQSTYKWGYFSFGCVALFSIWYIILWEAPRRPFPQEELRSGYYLCAAYVSFMLITYPICWACSEGANVISPTSEMVWYGILDIITGPFFLFFFLFVNRKAEYQVFDLQSGKYTPHEEPQPVSAKAAEAGQA
ncbi:hypothetical protein NM688_g8669 [Phlebia brevispora]|uniref:Uncharacterized protein n=1 Tax=Phlebia brevispora TaxID=194682 RepID=A0ACC1RQC0_9APHY|nr:hypothetical protein NM688_g8669 [Phlebia brevispora]